MTLQGGHRYPLAALLEATCLTESEFSIRMRNKGISFDGTTLKRARENGLVESAADKYATAIGVVPWVIWPEWLDNIIADESIPCEECGESFVPVRSGVRFCSRACSQRAYKRRRYHEDPEIRAKDNERARLWRENNRDIARKTSQVWRRLNPERVAAQSASRRKNVA
jgi:hypothetical protein